MKNTLFYLGLGTLFTHELDAIAKHEWRILPILRSLPEQVGMNTFVLLHIPLFAVLIALVASNDERLSRLTRLGVSAFLLIHAGLHLWFANDPNYEFASNISSALIFGGALFGGLHLVACFRDIRY
jgi:hypothetical protein